MRYSDNLLAHPTGTGAAWNGPDGLVTVELLALSRCGLFQWDRILGRDGERRRRHGRPRHLSVRRAGDARTPLRELPWGRFATV